jgi:hypothetical protein
MARIISSASSKPSTFQSPCPSPKLANLYSKSRSGKESFVFKRVPRPFYNLSLRLATEFSGSCRLRMHIDCNQEEGLLIYPCFRGTLLALIQDGLELPLAERKKILRRTGEAIQELHSKDWIHIGILFAIQRLF